MNIDEKMAILKDGSEEIVTMDDLEKLIRRKNSPKVYWGFECSGYIHIGIGLVTTRKMRHFIETGMRLTVLLADWHSWINNKFGGDLEKIRIAGEYFKHSFKALGVKGSNVKFMWADDMVSEKTYWETLIRVAKKSSLKRVIRSLPITGRRESDEIKEIAWLIYPLMQVTDIYMLDVDIAAAGVDQRKAHMLARDIAPLIKRDKPVFIHTPLLPSLNAEVPTTKEEIMYVKMSKSKPKSAIFIHDDEEVIAKKIRKGYCPPKEVARNPFTYLYKYIIFPYMRDKGKMIFIKTKKGNMEYTDVDELFREYSEGEIHPLDLKETASSYLVEILDPVRKYFDTYPEPLENMRRIMSLK